MKLKCFLFIFFAYLLSCKSDTSKECNANLDFTLLGKDFISSCELLGQDPSPDMESLVQRVIIGTPFRLVLTGINPASPTLLINEIVKKEIIGGSTTLDFDVKGFYKITVANENGKLSKWIKAVSEQDGLIDSGVIDLASGTTESVPVTSPASSPSQTSLSLIHI